MGSRSASSLAKWVSISGVSSMSPRKMNALASRTLAPRKAQGTTPALSSRESPPTT